MHVDAAVLAAFVEANPGVMPDAVAERLGVSVRTVRTYVHQANNAMEGFAAIELSRKNGYRLKVSDPEAYATWSADDRSEDAAMPQTPSERASYLLNDLLMRTDWVTLEDLCDVLFVSRSTASSDLKRVQKVLESYGLTLEKRPHYGIRVSGSEMARRLCLANLIMKAIDERATVEEGGIEAELEALLADRKASEGGEDPAHNQALEVISRCVERVSREEDFQINAVAYQNLLVHIAVALVRIRENCYVPMEPERLEQMKGKREYHVGERIAEAIEEETGVTLPEEEIAYIAIHLAGKRTVMPDPGDSNGEGLVISDEVWEVVSQMLERVWQAFRFDFRDDLELRMNLARHIVPLTVRLRYHMNLKNPLLEDIKVRYALAYSMAIDAATVLTEKYGTGLSDDETGYIALSFALALERKKTSVAKKNILVVCASGAGSARLLEYRCRREFGQYIDKIMTCDILKLDAFDFSQVDYVFTTVPIEKKLPVPIREVTYFLDTEDVLQVRELLGGEVPAAGIPPYFRRNLFFPHMAQRTKQEVLDFLLDQVCAAEDMPDNFRELVWKREGVVSTSFGNSVAMPHPLEAVSASTFICVGLLDHPVVWDGNGQMVQAVFLLAFSPEQDGSLHSFLGAFADVLMDKDAIGELVKYQTWETLSEVLGAALEHETARSASGSVSEDPNAPLADS